MNAIMTRRSIRKYLDKPVEPEKTERILRAAMQSPTARNDQAWEFLVVRDREMCQAVAGMTDTAVCAAKAAQLIVVLANLEKAVPNSDVWLCDMGAVCQNILLQIEEEGLGACWLACWPYERRMAHIRPLLELPHNIVPFAVIAMGYKGQEKPFEDRWDVKKVHAEKYGQEISF